MSTHNMFYGEIRKNINYPLYLIICFTADWAMYSKNGAGDFSLKKKKNHDLGLPFNDLTNPFIYPRLHFIAILKFFALMWWRKSKDLEELCEHYPATCQCMDWNQSLECSNSKEIPLALPNNSKQGFYPSPIQAQTFSNCNFARTLFFAKIRLI